MRLIGPYSNPMITLACSVNVGLAKPDVTLNVSATSVEWQNEALDSAAHQRARPVARFLKPPTLITGSAITCIGKILGPVTNQS